MERGMKRYYWIFILILVAGLAAFLYIQGKAQDSEPDLVEESVKTSKVRKGDIVISASGVGTVISSAEVQLGFSSSGTIQEIFVEEGDYVEKGEIIARLEDDPQLILDLETQKIAVLGSTGSIGSQALDIIARFPDEFAAKILISLPKMTKQISILILIILYLLTGPLAFILKFSSVFSDWLII